MPLRCATLRSLAKINLDLRILHKNPDGFHELRTVFQTISLADTIDVEFERSRRGRVTIDDTAGIADNLIVRAAKAILDEVKLAARVHFRLKKVIPMGGGLGGGSSNAAAVLLALPVLAGRPVSLERLTALGQALGSDVPFFLHGGAQLGLGRGTELYPLPELRAEPLLLAAAGVHVPTGPAYAALQRSLTFTQSSSSINGFQSYVCALGDGRSAWAANERSANDFESVVFKQFPQLKTIAARLCKFDAGVRMSGSGSTIFALFSSGEDRERAVASLGRDRVVRGCRLIEASLVSRRSYQRMWRRQLAGHVVPVKLGQTREDSWPLRSRYEQ